MQRTRIPHGHVQSVGFNWMAPSAHERSLSGRAHGAFSGPLRGLAPPGQTAMLEGGAIARFAGGGVANVWQQAKQVSLLYQLDVLPPLDLSRPLAMARVGRAGALLADGRPKDRGKGDRPRDHDRDQ